MADCIDCGKEMPETPCGTTICVDCARKRVAQLTPAQLVAMAKVGLDAVIDEATKYQQQRPKGELKRNFEKYLQQE